MCSFGPMQHSFKKLNYLPTLIIRRSYIKTHISFSFKNGSYGNSWASHSLVAALNGTHGPFLPRIVLSQDVRKSGETLEASYSESSIVDEETRLGSPNQLLCHRLVCMRTGAG